MPLPRITNSEHKDGVVLSNMDNKTLRIVQLLQLKIAKEIKRICDNNNIDYILDSGTLLGAVRHKGFIPWDDDMDIAMTRNNYTRFIEAAKTELGNEFFLQTWETDEFYPLPFAKIRLNGTEFVEGALEKAQMHHGIYVDVFPYDGWPKTRRKQKKLWNKKSFVLAMIMMKCKYMKLKSRSFAKFMLKLFMFSFVKFASLFYSKKALIRKYEAIVEKYSEEDSENVYEHSASHEFAHWVVPKSCLYETSDILFEDTVFKAPEDFDKYLSTAYGDYMTLPPESKRTGGHGILKVSFGEYENCVMEKGE